MLMHLFQQSLRDHTIPAIWKQAYVTPIYKKGNRSDPKNYRPVSLTSLICKTMEHILVSHIMKHLESNDILTEVQHGFRSKHSCEAQLFLTTDDLAKAIDNKTQVDMAILDFSKAFDKVAHNRLKHKLDLMLALSGYTCIRTVSIYAILLCITCGILDDYNDCNCLIMHMHEIYFVIIDHPIYTTYILLYVVLK